MPARIRGAAKGADSLAVGLVTECLADLDAAKKLDPEGDKAPEVQALRKRATGPQPNK